jgi:PBSX family phage terminase large subunit
MAKIYRKAKSIPFCFGDKHIEYIRSCVDCTYNIAEGAVRAGKTIDNVYAFAHELETCPDKIHLATGSTAANAKLNIGDSNGFGLEWIFRGQCRWGKYKGNECLVIKGPKTQYKQKVVIFAGAALANSFKKIRGNSYGMWIATEINLHHDNTIKEAFNRLLASKRRKIFWDLNPDNPNAPIYKEYIDKYIAKDKSGELLGGVNYQHFTIFDNINISESSRNEFISQYEPGTIWYKRDIEGLRCIAEGLIYRRFADTVTSSKPEAENPFLYKPIKDDPKSTYQFMKIVLGVDFGGNGSGHAFVATGITPGYDKVVALASERHFGDDIDPDKLGDLFVAFVANVIAVYGRISAIYCDSAEQVLIRGLQASLRKAGLGWVASLIHNAVKIQINDRINLTLKLMAQGRFLFREQECKTLKIALCSAVWSNKDPTKNERLDDGSSDIDTLDAFEYTIEQDYKRFLNK